MRGGKLLDPAWRKARASKAGQANAARARRQAIAAAEAFPTKTHAYARGYRTGYLQAAKYWRRRVQDLETRLAAGGLVAVGAKGWSAGSEGEASALSGWRARG